MYVRFLVVLSIIFAPALIEIYQPSTIESWSHFSLAESFLTVDNRGHHRCFCRNTMIYMCIYTSVLSHINAPWFLEAAWAIGPPAVLGGKVFLRRRSEGLRSPPSSETAGWAAGRTGRRNGPTWERGPPYRRHCRVTRVKGQWRVCVKSSWCFDLMSFCISVYFALTAAREGNFHPALSAGSQESKAWPTCLRSRTSLLESGLRLPPPSADTAVEPWRETEKC